MSDVPDEHEDSSDGDYAPMPPAIKIPFKVSVCKPRDTWGSIPQAILQDSDSDSDSDCPGIRRARMNYKMKMQCTLAFSMFLHERLGVESVWRDLPASLARKIIEMRFEEYMV